MAGRATVNRVVQVGLESVIGTPVAANRQLASTSIDIGPRFTSKEYRAAGYKYTTASRIHQAWAEGPLSGPIDYEQLTYVLASLIHLPTPTTPGGGTNSRQWVFLPNSTGADAFKSLTVEMGDADAAERAAGAVVRALTLEWTLDDANMSGTFIAKLPTTTTLTASPTIVPQMPVSAREIDVYMDPTFGAIGTTKVTDALRAQLAIRNKYNPKWVLNTSYPSWKDLVEVPVDLSFEFDTEHNAQSRTLFGTISSNPTQYMRVLATGPTIEGAIPYSLALDIACHVTAAEQTDVEGVWGYKYTCSPFHDASLGRPFKITLVNTRTAGL